MSIPHGRPPRSSSSRPDENRALSPEPSETPESAPGSEEADKQSLLDQSFEAERATRKALMDYYNG